MFVGCSKWTKEEKYDHCFFTIDVDIDEDELRDLMRDNGKLKKDITVNGKCNFLVHPRTHRATCRALCFSVLSKVQSLTMLYA
jgi:hypothetical protein